MDERGRWAFNNKKYKSGAYNNGYPEIKDDLKGLLTNLISSKILIPTMLDRDFPLQYDSVDELVDLIEGSGRFKAAMFFSLWGETVINTATGEEVYKDIVSIETYYSSKQSFAFCINNDVWLPMMMNKEDLSFSWNLERYGLNYHRIPALLKKLNDELGWSNEELLVVDSMYIALQAGYDFFMDEFSINWEYNLNPNQDFDLEAYLEAMKKAKEQYL